MNSTIRRVGARGLVALLLICGACSASWAGGASADDTAKFLAGMPLPEGSPLLALSKDRGFVLHAKSFDVAWKSLEDRQLSKVRAWSTKNLLQPKPVLYYMFSGPDFLYANGFFPDASTYILSGLEPTGQIPDVSGLNPLAISSELAAIDYSLRTILRTSFFITNEMSVRFSSHRLSGTLPILYVFLARTGHTIEEVSLVAIDKDGVVHPASELAAAKNTPRGVKIVFTKGQGPKKTLYYFQTDLANPGVGGSGFLKFCETFGQGDALVKSASYLLHSSGFSNVRDFLLKQANSIVQDDTGVPVGLFEAREWELRAFGTYLRPISVFAGLYQPKMVELFRKDKPAALEFGIGYHSRPAQSNLLLAIRAMRSATADR